MAKLTESQYQARQEDDQRKSFVQQVMQKCTDFLRRIIAAKKKLLKCRIVCWTQKESRFYKDSADPIEAKVFLSGSVCVFKLLAQTGAGQPGGHDLRGFCRSRAGLNITNEPKRFIEGDNHEAVKIGDLQKNSEAIKSGQSPSSTSRSARTRRSAEEWASERFSAKNMLGLPQQRRGTGYPCGEVGWRGGRLGAGSGEVPTNDERRECGPLEDDANSLRNTR